MSRALETERYMPPERVLQPHVDFYYVGVNKPQNEPPDQFWNRKGKAFSEE